ncbi:hypothetical protein CMV_025826 [Castanea mollissima]|uniref:Uncharacterized protein n=1 Tax=Castanea mollissima TaxID=60419 RepID=A0A8J4QF28_9ROSI|nr:hypothetical protein CMV_025826 [Castanea mollissima]
MLDTLKVLGGIGPENENHSPWYNVGMLAGATCQQFHAGWMHTLQLLACLQEPLVWARSFPVVRWDLLD